MSLSNMTSTTKQTIASRIAELRSEFKLKRFQLFSEGRSLHLQGLPKDTAGTYGCAWTAERGESLHEALDEAVEYLQNRVVA